MNGPLIGITPSRNQLEGSDIYRLNLPYAKLVYLAGGNPVILPYEFDGVQALDGILFSGGGDFAPQNAILDRPELSRGIVLERDEAEARLYREAGEMKLPILGICRGCQLLCVMAGGSLIADIPAAGFTEDHDLGRTGYHPVNCTEGSLAAGFFGIRGEVWSTHHQAVAEPGTGFRVTARSPEGVVEAIEHENGRMLGLQTHPEQMGLVGPFEWLVRLASK